MSLQPTAISLERGVRLPIAYILILSLMQGGSEGHQQQVQEEGRVAKLVPSWGCTDQAEPEEEEEEKGWGCRVQEEKEVPTSSMQKACSSEEGQQNDQHK